MTTKQMKKMKELNIEGKSDREISAEIGVSPNMVGYYRRQIDLPPGKRVRRVYKVYSKEGELIAKGTVKECAEQIGINFSAMWSRVVRAKKLGDKRIREVTGTPAHRF